MGMQAQVVLIFDSFSRSLYDLMIVLIPLLFCLLQCYTIDCVKFILTLLKENASFFLRCGFILLSWHCKIDKAHIKIALSVCKMYAYIEISVVHIQPQFHAVCTRRWKRSTPQYNYNRVVFIKPFNYTDHRFSSFSRYCCIYQRVKFCLVMVVSFSSILRFQDFFPKNIFSMKFQLHLKLGAAQFQSNAMHIFQLYNMIHGDHQLPYMY